MSDRSSRSQRRAQVLFALVVAGLALFAPELRAAIPPAGQLISSRSEASYERGGARMSVFSNTVTVSVAAASGVAVLPDGTAAAPAWTARGFAGETVYLPYLLRNAGNVADSFTLTAVPVAPSDFVPASAALYVDADRDSVLDPGETAVAVLGPLGPGEERALILAASLPAGLAGGERAHLDLVARSVADTSAVDRGNVSRIEARIEARVPVALAVDVAAALPGDTVAYTASFTNAGERDASSVEISSRIDRDGWCEGTTLVPGSVASSIGGAIEYYDGLASEWSATPPPADRVKGVRVALPVLAPGARGDLSFRVRVDDDRAAGWLRNVASSDYTAGDGARRQELSNETLVAVGRASEVSIGPRGDPGAATGSSADRVVATIGGGASSVLLWHEVLSGGNFVDSVAVAVADSSLIPSGWEASFVDSTGAALPSRSRFAAVLGAVPPGESAVVGLELRSTPEGLRRFDGRELVFEVEASSIYEPAASDRVTDVLVKADVPLVSITQSIREPVAMVGDVVSFIVSVQNLTEETPLDSVVVLERLSAGLAYAGGDLAPGRSGNELEWRLGSLAPRERRDILFRVRVAAGQEAGRLGGNAWASGVTAFGERAVDGPAQAAVLVVEGVFTRRGIVSGTVFRDVDGDGAQDAGERGIPSAAVYIDDGTYAVTDALGRYSIPGVVEGRHIVRVDPSSVADSLAPGDVGHFGLRERGQALVDLAPSGHRRVDFPFGAAPRHAAGPPADGPSAAAEASPRGAAASGKSAASVRGADGAGSGKAPVESFDAITIPSTQFAAGRAEIEGVPLSRVAALSLWIREHPGWSVFIEGHTDSIPIASAAFPSNLELSIARARSVYQLLRMNGIPEDRMDYTGRGDRAPVAPNATEAGRARNRRVEIRVVPPAGYAAGDPRLVEGLASAAGDTMALSDSTGVCADIVKPAEGSMFFSRSEIDVEVVSPLGSDVELYVNALPVGKDRIGLKRIDVAAGTFGSVFYGVRIEEGRNDLLVVCREYGGRRSSCVRHVYLAGQPRAIVAERSSVAVPADGRARPELVFLVSDRNGLPVRDGVFVTVSGPADLVDTLDANPQQPGVQAVTANGRVSLGLAPARDARREAIRVSLNGVSAACRVEYESALRPWFLMGYGEASMGYGEISGSGDRHRSLDRYRDGGWADGKLSFYGQGEIRGGHLLTASINTQPVRDDRLFRRIEPDKYYPVYGDASELRFNTASRSGTFLRLDHRRYAAQLGDFRTDFATTEFTRYHRSLNGLSGEARFRQGSVRGFVTSTDQVTYQEELPGEGTSGFYFLAHYPVVEGSEKIRVEVRDRYRPERIVRIDYRQANRDYDINYLDGSVLFKEPVPRFDDDLNTVVIVASYECRASENDNLLYGARASIAVSDSVRFGTTAVLAEEGVENYSLLGLDAAGRVLPWLRAEGEYAHSEKFLLGGGDAFRIGLASAGDRALRWNAYYRTVDAAFFNPSFSGGKTELGSRKLGAALDWRANRAYSIGVSGLRHELRERDERRYYADLVNRYSFGAVEGRLGFAGAGRRDTRDGDRASALLLTGLALKRERTRGEIQWDQIVAGDEVEEYPNRVQARLSRELYRRLSLVLKHEYRTGRRTGTRHLTQIGVESNLTERLQAYTRYQLEGAMGGERSQAVFGIKERFALAEDVAATVAIEKLATVSGEANDDHCSIAANAAFTPADGSYRAKGSYEIRLEPDRRKHLAELAGLRRMSERLALLAKGDLWFADEKIERNQVKASALVGCSVRPAGADALTVLSLARCAYEERTPAHPDGIDRELLASVEAVYRVGRDWELEGKIAARRVENTFRDCTVGATAFLYQAQVVRSFAGAWDASATARIVRQSETRTTSYGGGVEIGRVMAENLWAGVGYDFGGREDAGNADNAFSSRGFHVGMRLAFNERIMRYFEGTGEEER